MIITTDPFSPSDDPSLPPDARTVRANARVVEAMALAADPAIAVDRPAGAPGTARPRVLLCVDEFKAGGVTIVMIDLVAVLREHVDVELAALRPGPWLDRVEALGVPVTIAGPVRLARLMRRFDVVHTHSRNAGLLAVAAGRRARTVEHVHNEFRDQRLLSFRGGTLIAVSNAVRDGLRGAYPRLGSTPMHVVRNAAPPALLYLDHPRTRRGTLHLVGVGRLTEQKDPLRFLELAAALRRTQPGFRATWVGDGPLADDFTRRIDELRLNDVVCWEERPDRERTIELIATAGMLALTSRWEGFALVALEAMAVGTPIATTECGDIAVEIERLGIGPVLRGDPEAPGTVEQWASQVQSLWADEARWLAAAAAAKAAARDEFSMDALQREVLAVYETVLHPGRSTAPAGIVEVGPFPVLDATAAEVVERIADLAGRRSAVFALHVGGLNHRSDPQFVADMRRADLVHADGMTAVLIGRLAGARALQRAATTDIGLPAVRRIGERLGRPPRIGLVGGAPGIAERAAQAVAEQTGGEVVFVDHGFRRDWMAPLDALRDARPDVVIVGMGMPREARWVMAHREELPEAVVLTCGGWFGFLAGVEHRAPVVLQRTGTEWVYRVLQAPGRLGPRYVQGVLTTARLAVEELTSGRLRRR